MILIDTEDKLRNDVTLLNDVKCCDINKMRYKR